jgi:hypothetical protein
MGLKGSGMSLSNRHLLLAGLVGLTGCQFFTSTGGNGGAAYPTNPPGSATTAPAGATAATAEIPTAIKVPADAQELVKPTDYPLPSFTVPSQPGTIEVVDMDGDPTVAVASASVTGTEANKSMSISDVPSISASLNKTHKYRIVFVPAKTGTP